MEDKAEVILKLGFNHLYSRSICEPHLSQTSVVGVREGELFAPVAAFPVSVENCLFAFTVSALSLWG